MPLTDILTTPIFLVSAGLILACAAIAVAFNRPRRQAAPVVSIAELRRDRPKKGPVPATVPDTRFGDVAGVAEAVAEVRELCDYLANPEPFQALGATLPKGVLLSGPPGTGKTLLTRALAGEAGVPLYAASAAGFVEVYVGVGASRVRELFAEAKKHAPSVVFIDELDAIGRMRAAHGGGGHDERESTLNQLLVEMDGFEPNSGVIVVGATNRPDLLDSALLRRGRFDRHISLDAPDLEGRRSIIAVHARNKRIGHDVDLESLARRTPGFTGADLANVVNEAALLAARSRRSAVTMHDLEEALDRIVAGPARPSRMLSEREQRIIAYHEGGHALVAAALAVDTEVEKISIVPRGQTHGFTLAFPVEDRVLVTRDELERQLAVLLAGRVAEELVFADPTTGAQSDLERATAIAHKMVASYGMSERFGSVSLGSAAADGPLVRGDDLLDEIDAEMRKLIAEARELAMDVLTSHAEELDELVRRLIMSETLYRDEIAALIGHVRRAEVTPMRSRARSTTRTGGGEPAAARPAS